MTTIDQPLSTPRRLSHEDQPNALNGLFARAYTLNWEMIIYIIIFALALFTRFYALGERVMSHDESLHTLYSYNLYNDGNFEHTPLMHGPILFHFTAFFYFLFGPSDFSARIYAAVLGILIVMYPLLFRRWLGRWGAILASTMLLISPLMMFYSRYIREDMPAIIASITMAYAILMYLSGPENQRRRAHWLYLLAGAMLWNLASKETAFIYIGIFGLFVTLYWLTRMAQHYLNLTGKPIFYTIAIGFMLAVLAALGMIVVVSVSFNSNSTSQTIASTLGIEPAANNELIITLSDRLRFLGNQFGTMFEGKAVTNDFVGFLSWTGVVITSLLSIIIGTALWAYKSGKAMFTIPDLIAIPLTLITLIVVANVTTLGVGLLIATSLALVYAAIRLRTISPLTMGILYVGAATAALVIYWVMQRYDILPKAIEGVGASFDRAAVLILLLAAVIGTGLAVVVLQSAGKRSFGRRTVLLLAIIIPLCLVFLVIEEETRVHLPREDNSITATPIILAWVLGGIALVGIIYLKRRGLFKELERFPEFDVLMLMGSLILPWVTAVFIVSAHGNPQDFIDIGNSLAPFLRNNIPVGEVNPGQEIEMVGRVFLGFLAWVPMITVAIVAGLAWDWRRWLVSSLIFHALFVFFYTTIFTNIEGLATGMIYSLQYWLEQQEVQRGSQPQYYYLLVIMPFYEFLPVIGGGLAMTAGMVMFWRKNRARQQPQLEAAVEAIGFSDDIQLVDAPREEPSLTALLGEDDRQMIVTDPIEVVIEEHHLERGISVAPEDRLTQLPFLLFVGFWGVMNLLAFTLAGEKMPWLGTHMTVPLILLTGWYFGGIVERIDLRKFIERGWIYLILLPLLFITVFQIIAPYLGGRPPFQGQERIQLSWTYGWLAAVGISAVLIAIVFRLTERTGWRHLRQMFAIALFSVLAVFTLRSAWTAAFINYDLGKEFLVYAHGGPGNGLVVEQLKELSLRTTGGMDINFAYDDGMHWPGLWYFRDFTNKVGFGNNPTLQQIDAASVVVVANEGLASVQPLLQDRFQEFTYVRMYWPMQDYYDLTSQRLNDLFDFSSANTTASSTRRGIFDIWWARDYTTYGTAVGRQFENTQWPLMDELHFFVRKDIAAEVWQLGTGDGTATSAIEQQPSSACVTNWQQLSADIVFNTTNSPLLRPISLAVSPDDRLVYVAEEGGNRISIFTSEGQYVSSFGQQGTGDQQGAFFERPHDVAFAPDGSFYVADFWNHRIRVFDAQNNAINAWGQPSFVGFDAPEQPVDGFYGPRDVIVGSDGSVYVADTGNKRVRVYSAEGVFLRDIGGGGSLPGELDEPVGLALAPDGRLFVADTWNRRISIFDSNGTFITSFNVEGWTGKPNSLPYLALDAARNMLYVSDGDAGRILVYNTAGECVGAFGQYNIEQPNATQFAAIGGLALDSVGNLYVSDTGSARVLRFTPFPESAVELNSAPDDSFAIEGLANQAEATQEAQAADAESTEETPPEATSGQ